MRVKKLTAIVLAVAMAAIMLPSFVAMAEESPSDLELLNSAKALKPVFDAMAPAPYEASDTAIRDAWPGSGWSGTVASEVAYLNVAGGLTNPRIQAYESGSSEGSDLVNVINLPGYGAGSDYVVFSFTAEMTAAWGDVAFVDTEGKLITAFRYGLDGLNVEWGHTGWGTPYSFEGRSYLIENDTTISLTSGATKIDVLMRNYRDENKYTASIFANGALETVTTYSGETFNGLGAIKMCRGSGDAYQRISFLKPEVYAPCDTYYTVEYKSGDTKLRDPESVYYISGNVGYKGYNNEEVFPYVDIPYFDGYVFKNKEVSGLTVTLNYEPVIDGNFFDNVDNSTSFISLNMLGAHDAFTSGISGSVKRDAAGTKQGDSGSVAATVFNTGSAKSRAQSGDALELLNVGVRYFDVRLSRSDTDAKGSYSIFSGTAPHTNGVFYTTHGMLSDELRPVAHTIGQWLKTHPGELVVLDFQEVYDYTTTAESEGDSNARTWRSIDALLNEAGILDYVTAGNGDINGLTYGGLTSNGTRAGAVLFGRAVATNSGVGKFILRGDTSGAFNGKVYSNYSYGVSQPSSFSADYIQGQADYMLEYSGDNPIKWMFRVMQAQSGGSNLIEQAAKDNTSLYDALTNSQYSGWLSCLPVVMVDDAVTNTGDILNILKECNQKVDLVVSGSSSDGAFTGTTRVMIGTLISTENMIVNSGDDKYYITNGEPDLPAPYNKVLEGLTVEKITSNVYTVQGGCYYISDLTDNGEYTGKDNFGAYNWGVTGTADRVGVAVLDVTGGDKYTLSASRIRNYGSPQASIYAISYEDYISMDMCDAADFLIPENLVCGDIDESEETLAQELDPEVMNAAIGDSGKVVLLGNAYGGLYGLKGADMKIYSRGSGITPMLGYDGDGLVLDFEVTQLPDVEGASSYDMTVTSENGRYTAAQQGVSVGDKVGISHKNSNMLYTAVVSAGGIEVAVASGSLYAAVANNLYDNKEAYASGRLNSARVAAVNKVITDGGVCFDENGLTPETALIMSLSDDRTTVTVDSQIFALGIGFVPTETICVGDGTELTVVTEGSAAVYNTLTLSDGKAILSVTE